MRYTELFERDQAAIITKLRALIDHPNTEPALKSAAEAKLATLLKNSDSIFAKCKRSSESEFVPLFPEVTSSEFKPGFPFKAK